MSRLFIDSSVLFSAAYSVRGHAHDIIRMAVQEEVTLVISQLVLTETRRNLAESVPAKLVLFDYIVESIPFEFVRPSKREVSAAAKRVALKDAPILAAARKAGVDFLVTLDKKHLLGKPDLARYARTKIAAPQEVFEYLTQE